MREALRKVWQSGRCEHAGLAYEVWAPVAAGSGKVADQERDGWLDGVVAIEPAADYGRWFELWQARLRSGQHPRHQLVEFELELSSRMLIGHGNAAPTEVGLTLHQLWGVPMIPGSALKGLLAHYVDATYGPEPLPGGRALHPADPERAGEQRQRARYQGPTWRGHRILHGPGEVYRALFGSPPADSDAEIAERLGLEPPQRSRVVGAIRGRIVFYDALYVPGSARDPQKQERPLVPDVLTVHQRRYYGQGEARARQQAVWPCDYDSPNPVAFLTVRPGARFWVVLGGPPGWVQLASRLLEEAITHWGVGAKTSQGYARAKAISRPAAAVRAESGEASGTESRAMDPVLAEFHKWLENESTALPHREALQTVAEQWLKRLQGLVPAALREAVAALRRRFPPKLKKVRKELDDLLRRLGGTST